MAIEDVAHGYDAGWVWNVDHDIAAGTIGTTVTNGQGVTPTPGTLNVKFVIVRNSDATVIRTITLELTQFWNLGRQVLYTNAVLVGVVMNQPKGTVAAFSLNPSTTFTPTPS